MRLTNISVRTAAAVALCLSAGSLSGPALAKDHAKHSKPPVDDSKLTCKQLSGRIQVLILQTRTYDPQKQQSQLSRALQGASVTALGNNAKGADPGGSHAADLQTLRDYNQRLVELGCKSYNLEAELNNQDPNETPAATVPAVKKPKPAAATPAPQ